MATAAADLRDDTVLARTTGEEPLVYIEDANGNVEVHVGQRTYRMSSVASPAFDLLQLERDTEISELNSVVGQGAALKFVKALLRIGYLTTRG